MSELPTSIKGQHPNFDIKEVLEQILPNLLSRDIPSEEIIEKLQTDEFSGFINRNKWIDLIKRGNLEDKFTFLIRSNEVAFKIWTNLNTFSHVDMELRKKIGPKLTKVMERIIIPTTYQAFETFLIIVRDMINTTNLMDFELSFRKRYLLQLKEA
jgi:hypothetical protein